MAPDVAKVDADRDLNLGLPAWDFSDEVLRWLLHGNSLLLLRRTCSSHLSVLILGEKAHPELSERIALMGLFEIEQPLIPG